MLQVQLLPAKQGDAIWLRWGDATLSHQAIIDMGTPGVGNVMRRRLEQLVPADRRFEVVVVTHIDADHIGGVLSALAEGDKELAHLEIDDLWFNGLDHLLEAPSALEEHGGEQGRRLVKWLSSRRWNEAFGRRRICLSGAPEVVELAGGLRLTVLGPPPERLKALAPVWRKDVADALRKREASAAAGSLRERGLEAHGRRKPPEKPELRTRADLEELANDSTGGDHSEANGSSIVLLAEHGEGPSAKRVLLTGDAYAGDILEGIRVISAGGPLRLDAFKLPHHGSSANLTRELVEAVDCPLFLVSTDGTQFYHPDAAAMACVVAHARRRPGILGFNARCTYTDWWDSAAWKKRFEYEARYGTPEDGLIVDL